MERGGNRLTKKALIITIAAAMAAAMAGVADGATSVSITSPRNGANIFLRRTPSLSVAGTAAFAPATASSTKFYLRRDGCGTSNDNPHLSVTSGTDQGDGCGLVVSSVAGPGGTVDQGAFVDYPSQDGTPLAFDASRAITGVIDIENFSAAA